MIIVAGGDSFVWGSELQDCPHGGPDGYSRRTYSALLAKNHEYVCAAYPGNSNEAIARNTILACEKYKSQQQQIFAIVTWSFNVRFEFRFQNDSRSWWESISPWSIGINGSADKEVNGLEINRFTTKAKDLGIKDFAETYYKFLGLTGFWQCYVTLKEIVYLQNYLKANNIPYMFTCADNIIFDNHQIKNIDDETINALYDQIDFSQWFLFPEGTDPGDTLTPRGFYQWAVENKYNIGAGNHPLEDAHKDAAELIKEKFNELVKKSI